MAYDQTMADRVRAALNNIAYEERLLFGSLGFMINQQLALCVRDTNIMYKFGPEKSSEVIAQGIAQPVIMGGRTSKGWAYIDNQTLEDDNAFAHYFTLAVVFVRE
jgi:hypothetical protein